MKETGHQMKAHPLAVSNQIGPNTAPITIDATLTPAGGAGYGSV
jgi:hypothetical protein